MTSTGNTLQLGAGNETQLSDRPEEVVIDRCYIHRQHLSAHLDRRTGLTTPTVFPNVTNFTFTNNIEAHNAYGTMGSGSSPDGPTFTAYLPTGLNFSYNIVEGTKSTGSSWAGNYNQPGRVFNNFFPTTWGAVYSDMSSYVVDGAAYNNQGSDGTDPGVNMDLLNAAQNGNNPPTSFFTDTFNDNLLDDQRWVADNLLSSATDPSIVAAERNTHIEIGPLPSGATGLHDNGIRTKVGYTLTDAYVAVRLVQAADATATASYAAGAALRLEL